jgi:hypothetical protein
MTEACQLLTQFVCDPVTPVGVGQGLLGVIRKIDNHEPPMPEAKMGITPMLYHPELDVQDYG